MDLKFLPLPGVILPKLDFDVPFDSQLAFCVCVGDLYEAVIKAVRRALVLRGRGSQVELRQKHSHLSSPTECAGLIGPRPQRVLFLRSKCDYIFSFAFLRFCFTGGLELSSSWQVALCKACTFSKGIHLACLTAKCSLKCARGKKKFSSAHQGI